MNISLLILEISVVILALALLLVDLWTPPAAKARLGYAAAVGLLIILGISFVEVIGCEPAYGFGGLFVQDGLAVFFKRFFIVAAIFAILMGIEFADRIKMGIVEFYAIILLALAGMMLAASANDFILLFVALELITVCFYVLVSFQRSRLVSLEAGVKYLILSSLSTSFLIFGIAFIFGTANSTSFSVINSISGTLRENKMFWLGLTMVLVALGFKISAFPMQVWAPDVYQGAPAPVTAFLAIGSKAAGFVLLLRVLFTAVPGISSHWSGILICGSAISILYGNLCAIPQRNLKRLLGYSSISNAGYILLGVAAFNADGSQAVLYYLAGYLFALAAAFTVICVVTRDSEDISVLAGLNHRSPLLAWALTLSMVSLAGIPPLAGFFGKFLLLKSIIEQSATNPAYLTLALIAAAGVVISLYYYFGVIRAIYWSADAQYLAPIALSAPVKISLVMAMVGMLYLGLCPQKALSTAADAVKALHF